MIKTPSVFASEGVFLHIFFHREVETVHSHSQKPLTTACYRSGSRILLFVGIGLILLGLFLLIFCVPLWFYLAILGIALIVLGAVVLRK